jgi:hypothetical protein
VRKHRLRCGLIACLLACIAGLPGYARAEDNKEALVKAAFIYNFVKFVEWPGDKAISKQANIDICVLGDSSMSKTGEVFKAASTAKLSLSLKEEKNARSAAAHCHIVFVGSSEAGRLGDVLASFKGQPVLTVSDIDGFAEAGGMIGFATNDNKVKIVVNKKPVSAAGMRVDAQLLEIALQVIDR